LPYLGGGGKKPTKELDFFDTCFRVGKNGTGHPGDESKMTIENPESEQSESQSESHSVTQYIDGLRQGDQEAAQRVWERFLKRLIRHADRKLKATRRRSADEEDVVQKAFAQFFRQVELGRFPKLNDRNDLWQVLAMLVERRAIDQIRKNNTQRQGDGDLHGESIFIQPGEMDRAGIAGMPDMNPTPEMAAELTDVFRQRIDGLGRDDYRQIALLKMEGFTNREISEQLGTSLRTVERRLDQIRSIWSGDSKK
jgi:RNA polymerase sigma factor (sigma-70 family)